MQLDPLERPQSATEQLHDILFRKIVSMEFLPGQKISEVEIARQHDVSRQPVRDAFYRLSQQGLLNIRPQRATVITHISSQDVEKALFIRVALEKEIVRAAARRMNNKHATSLRDLVERQEEALGRKSDEQFYIYDELFHQKLCAVANQPNVWTLISDTKAPADRVRFLSLEFDGQTALSDHKTLLEHLIKQDGEAAANIIDIHLSRVMAALPRIQTNHPERFKERP